MICMIREMLCVLVGCSAFMLHSEPEEKQSAKVLKTEQKRSEQEQVWSDLHAVPVCPTDGVMTALGL